MQTAMEEKFADNVVSNPELTKYINTIQELSSEIDEFEVNIKLLKSEPLMNEENLNDSFFSQIVFRLLSSIKVYRVKEGDANYFSDDFYLIIKENIKMRLLSSRMILLSKLNVSPLNDLYEASELINTYFSNDKSFYEIDNKLDDLINQIKTNKTFN